MARGGGGVMPKSKGTLRNTVTLAISQASIFTDIKAKEPVCRHGLLQAS